MNPSKVILAVAVMSTALPAIMVGQEEDTQRREEYFWARRAGPGGVRPYAQMLAAINAVNARRTKALLAVALSGSWRPLGPFGFVGDNGFFGSAPQLDAGRVVGIQPPRVAGGPFYIAAASGGVWKASALGSGWTPLTDTQCTLNMGSITTDPKNSQIVYAGTGEYNTFSFGCGILRSIDGGTTWTVSSSGMVFTTGDAASQAALLVDSATAGSTTTTIVLAATSAGIYRSINSGTLWTRSTQITSSPSSIVRAKNGAVFVGVRDFTSGSPQAGVWKSTNFGVSWTKLSAPTGINTSLMGRIELATSANDPNKVYALIADKTNRGLVGLWVYDDATSTWTHPAASGVVASATASGSRANFGLQSEYDFTIAADPRNANRVYIAGVRAYRSTDGGATFSLMAMEIHCDWHQIVIDPLNPDVIYAGTDGGIFMSTDAGDTWVDRNAGLAITQYYPGISIHPTGTFVMGGSQDNGSHMFTGSTNWNSFNGGDGGFTAINYLDPTIQYGESQWSTTNGATIVRRSGTSYSSRNSGILSSDRAEFIPPLVMDPMTPTTLYFGTHKLYKTTNEGTSWTAVASGSDFTYGTGDITAIAVSNSTPQAIYVGTSDGMVVVSLDGGQLYQQRIGGLPTPPRTVTKIAIDPANPSHAILTLQGYGAAGGHVFETTDGGATPWKNISGDLVNVGVNSVAIVNSAGSVYVVGTDVGLFQTVNGGTNWTIGPAGMPNVIVNDLLYQPSTNTLIAATYGRGMFSFQLGTVSTVLRGDANADGKVDAADALIIQQALISTLTGSTNVYPRGDANCNGAIDAADVLLVLRKAVGLSTTGTCVGTTA